MPKITFIGAGSTVFAKNLIGDILSFPELAESEIVLYDIDSERLATSELVAHKVAQTLGARPKIVATTDREQALEGAHYAINMIQVGGYKPATVIDFEIPKKYGLRQTIADTLGIGGIMRAVRTIPVLLEMSRDMERLSPGILHLNYVNPMAMNMWALQRASSIKSIGLCHSVQHTASEICNDIGVPVEEVNYLVAGINHMAYFLRLEHNGQDLYPRLRAFAEGGKTAYRDHGDVRLPDRLRYEMFKRLGYFVTESSEHHAEYLPYFIKRDRPDLIERYGIPLDEYIRRCESQIAGWATQRQELLSASAVPEVRRSVEYGSGIIHSLVTGQPRVIYGNVLNDGLIDNLPQDCCVEVPCLVDKNGIQPTKIGKLPPHLAALMRTNINVQELTVEAILTGNREHLYHAAMLDPHTAAELDLDQIWNLVDELMEAHGEYVPISLRSRKATPEIEVL